jgi:hypothetical protein
LGHHGLQESKLAPAQFLQDYTIHLKREQN